MIIPRLQECTGPSREMDAEIYASIHGGGEWVDNVLRIPSLKLSLGSIDPGKHSRNFTIWFAETPHYTGSIDSALTLVPEGWLACEMHQKDPTLSHFPNRATVLPHNTNDIGWAKPKGKGSSTVNLALAICIAALRARGIE